MIRALDKQVGERGFTFSEAVRFCGGHCPAGCRNGPLSELFPDTVVYRSSKRAVTMRCNDCGLLWTMTIHQLAKSARRNADQAARVAERERGRGDDDELTVADATAWAMNAKRLEQWADQIGERRGRTIGTPSLS
jgi:hypothetical protein